MKKSAYLTERKPKNEKWANSIIPNTTVIDLDSSVESKTKDSTAKKVSQTGRVRTAIGDYKISKFETAKSRGIEDIKKTLFSPQNQKYTSPPSQFHRRNTENAILDRKISENFVNPEENKIEKYLTVNKFEKSQKSENFEIATSTLENPSGQKFSK